MKNITLSADERDIRAARERARAENTTLNEQFRRWLAEYAARTERIQAARQTIRDLQAKIQLHGPYTRDRMNER